MRFPVRPFTLALYAAIGILGCIDDGSGTSSGSASSSGAATVPADSGATTTAGQACFDEADAYAAAAQRCGGVLAQERTAFIKDIAGGDCNSVTIRDEAQLRSGCIPSFSSISCDDLMNSRFDPTCAEQIVRTR